MARRSLRVLILGGTGMLGHRLWMECRDEFETFVTFRRLPINCSDRPWAKLFDPARTRGGVDATNFESIRQVIDETQPSIVINCIGIIKQLREANDPITSLQINALLPHELKEFCHSRGIRLIHISTDCVFSGRRGNYRESDPSDAEDLYGRTKFFGEVTGEGILTLRTSIIGRELEARLGLVEWFLSQKGKTVKGYTRVIYSGITTPVLSQIIVQLLRDFPKLSGLYQVAGQMISKYALLKKIQEFFHLNVEISPYGDFQCNRSLDGSQFVKETGIQIPGWDEMISGLYLENKKYGGIYES